MSVSDIYSPVEMYTALNACQMLDEVARQTVEQLAQQFVLSDTLQCIFLLYEAFRRHGYIRMPTEMERLTKQWRQIEKSPITHAELDVNSSSDNACDPGKLAQTIQNAIQSAPSELQGLKPPLLGRNKDENALFMLENGYLYTKNLFNAKCDIENWLTERVKAQSTTAVNTNDKIDNPNERPDFVLNDAQKLAIRTGLSNPFLIVTGGPGTGKTTVMLYVLWNLLIQHPELLNADIYLTAPSGKAAERLSESLKNNLNDFSASAKSTEAYYKLCHLEGQTIHRLLTYQPSTNHFKYSKSNPFDPDSIFVIDEASMIDVHLFAELLSSIPPEARVIVLGDANQLPSVGAGAIFAELVHAPKLKTHVITLNESKRFGQDSRIGKLAQGILEARDASNTPQLTDFSSGLATIATKVTVITPFTNLPMNDTRKAEKAEIEKISKTWFDKYYAEIRNKAKAIDPEDDESSTNDICQNCWNAVTRSRILCAERHGKTSIEVFNQAIDAMQRHLILHEATNTYDEDATNESFNQYFVGQLVLITRNQHNLGVYNGDNGVIVKSASGRLYVMLKKSDERNHRQFAFYPMSTLDASALETAYAITIHKAQGSEYDHIMVVLPTNESHPLLTKKVLYTGITRAKISVTLVTTTKAFEIACVNDIKRDGTLEFS